MATEVSSIRLKGLQPKLRVFRKEELVEEELNIGMLVKEDDDLQICFNPANRKYGVILSIEGRVTVTLHHPNNVNGSAEILEKGDITLNYAYKLDDVPEYEKFVRLTSDNELNVEFILNKTKIHIKNFWYENIKNLHLLDPDYQTPFNLRKE